MFTQDEGKQSLISIKKSKAGESLQAAIQAIFVAENSVLMAQFEDLINAEENKLTGLIKMAHAMHFIKYKKDFYTDLQ